MGECGAEGEKKECGKIVTAFLKGNTTAVIPCRTFPNFLSAEHTLCCLHIEYCLLFQLVSSTHSVESDLCMIKPQARTSSTVPFIS